MSKLHYDNYRIGNQPELIGDIIRRMPLRDLGRLTSKGLINPQGFDLGLIKKGLSNKRVKH